jgi:hypothetical protein
MEDDLTISAPHWGIASQFVARSVAPPTAEPMPEPLPEALQRPETNVQPAPIPMPKPIPEAAKGKPVQKSADIAMESGDAAPIRMTQMEQPMAEVIDLPVSENESGILDAVVRQGGAEGRWMQCPIRPPMCPKSILAIDRDRRLMLIAVAAKGLNDLRGIGLALRWMSENRELIRMALPQLAIDRDRRLMLIAVAAKGLNDLRGIGLALRWMSENRELIRMALPQLAIDIQAAPGACLLVDHADLSAEILQPILQSETISVQAYRKVKWGSKTGLLLEAA